MDSFRDVIAQWPSAEALAADLDEKGVTVRAWRNRNSIPPAHWSRVVAAAQARGIGSITHELLANIAAGIAGRAPVATGSYALELEAATAAVEGSNT